MKGEKATLVLEDKKGNIICSNTTAAIHRSRTDSNQPEPLSIEPHVPEQTALVKKKAKRSFSDTGNRTRALPALYSELTLQMRAANPSH